MAVWIELEWMGKPTTAVVHGGEWTCKEPDLKEMLDSSSLLGKRQIEHHNPHPDYALAQFVIEDVSFIEGRIIRFDPPPRAPGGRIF